MRIRWPLQRWKWHCVVFDLDGTLCNTDHRVHYAHSRQWDKFNSALVDDNPNWDELSLLLAMRESGHRIVLCTGRDAAYRKATQEWLKKWGVPYDLLLMRDERDRRSDTVVKCELARQIPWPILFIVEDRDRVVEMWRREGYTCLQNRFSSY